MSLDRSRSGDIAYQGKKQPFDTAKKRRFCSIHRLSPRELTKGQKCAMMQAVCIQPPEFSSSAIIDNSSGRKTRSAPELGAFTLFAPT